MSGFFLNSNAYVKSGCFSKIKKKSNSKLRSNLWKIGIQLNYSARYTQLNFTIAKSLLTCFSTNFRHVNQPSWCTLWYSRPPTFVWPHFWHTKLHSQPNVDFCPKSWTCQIFFWLDLCLLDLKSTKKILSFRKETNSKQEFIQKWYDYKMLS